MATELEVRTIPAAELRVVDADGDDPARIVGHAATFNQLSVDLGGFREKVDPGAFARLLASKPDVRALMNHDSNLVLGRTTSGTLRLREDATGLLTETVPPDTQPGRDALELVRRGDITGMSFSFRANDVWEVVGGEHIRTLTEITYLGDIGPATYPAYQDTSVAVRSLDAWHESTRHDEHNRHMRLRLAESERGI